MASYRLKLADRSRDTYFLMPSARSPVFGGKSIGRHLRQVKLEGLMTWASESSVKSLLDDNLKMETDRLLRSNTARDSSQGTNKMFDKRCRSIGSSKTLTLHLAGLPLTSRPTSAGRSKVLLNDQLLLTASKADRSTSRSRPPTASNPRIADQSAIQPSITMIKTDRSRIASQLAIGNSIKAINCQAPANFNKYLDWSTAKHSQHVNQARVSCKQQFDAKREVESKSNWKQHVTSLSYIVAKPHSPRPRRRFDIRPSAAKHKPVIEGELYQANDERFKRRPFANPHHNGRQGMIADSFKQEIIRDPLTAFKSRDKPNDHQRETGRWPIMFAGKRDGQSPEEITFRPQYVGQRSLAESLAKAEAGCEKFDDSKTRKVKAEAGEGDVEGSSYILEFFDSPKRQAATLQLHLSSDRHNGAPYPSSTASNQRPVLRGQKVRVDESRDSNKTVDKYCISLTEVNADFDLNNKGDVIESNNFESKKKGRQRLNPDDYDEMAETVSDDQTRARQSTRLAPNKGENQAKTMAKQSTASKMASQSEPNSSKMKRFVGKSRRDTGVKVKNYAVYEPWHRLELQEDVLESSPHRDPADEARRGSPENLIKSVLKKNTFAGLDETNQCHLKKTKSGLSVFVAEPNNPNTPCYTRNLDHKREPSIKDFLKIPNFEVALFDFSPEDHLYFSSPASQNRHDQCLEPYQQQSKFAKIKE